jgi:hypothetical protein
VEGYYIAIPQPRRKTIPSFGYSANTMGLIILVQAIEGVLLMPIITQFTCNTPFKISHKSFGFHNISLELGQILHSPNKT